MPSTKKSNVSIRLKKKPLTFESAWSHFVQEHNIATQIDNALQVDTVECAIFEVDNTISTVSAPFGSSMGDFINSVNSSLTVASQEKEYELYYKHNLICKDTDKNKLRRIGYLIRKNIEK